MSPSVLNATAFTGLFVYFFCIDRENFVHMLEFAKYFVSLHRFIDTQSIIRSNELVIYYFYPSHISELAGALPGQYLFLIELWVLPKISFRSFAFN